MIDQSVLLELLKKEKYENYVVADAERFRKMIPKERRREVLERARTSILPPVPPVPSSGSLKIATFLQGQKIIDRRKAINGLKSAECDSFSVHALSVLAKDESIRKHYNIIKVSSMFDPTAQIFLHNHLILVPKEQALILTEQDRHGHRASPRMLGPNFLGDGRDNILPPGSLIVDPWARGLGYPENACLAVSPEEFCFATGLYPFEVHYQSVLDDTFNETFGDDLSHVAAIGSTVSEIRATIPISELLAPATLSSQAPSPAQIDEQILQITECHSAILTDVTRIKVLAAEAQLELELDRISEQPVHQLSDCLERIIQLEAELNGLHGHMLDEHEKALAILNRAHDWSVLAHMFDGPVTQKYHDLKINLDLSKSIVSSVSELKVSTSNIIAKKYIGFMQSGIDLIKAEIQQLILNASEEQKQVDLYAQNSMMDVRRDGRLIIDTHLANIQSIEEEATAKTDQIFESIDFAKEKIRELSLDPSSFPELVVYQKAGEKELEKIATIQEKAKKSIAALQVSQAKTIVKQINTNLTEEISTIFKLIEHDSREAITPIKEFAEAVANIDKDIQMKLEIARASTDLINDGQYFWFVGWNGPVKKDFEELIKEIEIFDKIKDKVTLLLAQAKIMETSLYKPVPDLSLLKEAQAKMKSMIQEGRNGDTVDQHRHGL